jgi:hypothetical protein
MKLTQRIALAGILALTLTAGPTMGQDNQTAQARKIFQDKQDAILWIEASVKLQVSAQGLDSQTLEDKVSAIGTVIDETGLMVASLGDLDPAVQYDGRQQRNRQTGQTMTLSASSEFTEVKVRMPDKTEVPAKIVMKDVDWDLVFVQIDTTSEEFEGQKLSPVKLNPESKAQELDHLVVLARLNKNMKYIPAVSLGRIAAVTRRPRTLYVSQGGQLGTPAFLLNGEALGVFVVWRNRAENSQVRVILPAQDVLDIARQASAAAEKIMNAQDDAQDEAAEDAADDAADEAEEEETD